MAVGLKQVSESAGVSVQTASDILNCGRSHRYSAETQERVRAVALEEGYHPQRLGRMMRSRSTRMVGFVAPNASDGGSVLRNHKAYPFMVGLSHRLVQDQYHVANIEVGELADEQALPDMLRERFFDGLVIHYGLSPQVKRIFESLNLPVVWWDSGLFEPTGCIYRDEPTISRSVTRRLIDQGHRRIAFMVGQSGWEKYLRGLPMHFSYLQRYENYLAEMQANGLQHAEIVGYEVDSVASQIAELGATAVIVQGAGDLILILSQAAARLGGMIGRDLSIASLDLEARIDHSGFTLSGMTYDRYAAGEQAAAMMLQLLSEPEQPVPSVRLHCDWRDGATIAPLPASQNVKSRDAKEQQS